MLNIEGTNKFVQFVTTDSVRCGLSLANGTTGFEAVVCRKVQFTTGFVNVQARLLVAEGNEQVSHESPEEVAAPIRILFKNADGDRV